MTTPDFGLAGRTIVVTGAAQRIGAACARRLAGGGPIVPPSSINRRVAIPTIASGNARKGGVDQLTRALALALADHGIRARAVAPGSITTELARSAVHADAPARARILERTPVCRPGEPDEVAAVVAFLLRDAAGDLTGEIVVVDGGRMAPNYKMRPRAADGA